MRWTERQRAMLREMGVRTWARASRYAVAPAGEEGTVGVAEREPVAEAMPVFAPATAPRPAPPTTSAALAPADWLVVGEPFDPADGAQERLLDNMLQAIRVSRTAPGRDGRAAYVVYTEGAKESLREALAEVRPRCALALGRAAAQALLGIDEPIGHLRGSVHDRGGVSVVISFALVYLLRHPSEKAKAWADLCLAVRALETRAG